MWGFLRVSLNGWNGKRRECIFDGIVAGRDRQEQGKIAKKKRKCVVPG
jgi:hypothetical protein